MTRSGFTLPAAKSCFRLSEELIIRLSVILPVFSFLQPLKVGIA